MPEQHPLLWLYETGTKTGKRWEGNKDVSPGGDHLGLHTLSAFGFPEMKQTAPTQSCSRSQP